MSANELSKIATISWRSRCCSTGTTTSIRLSRLRVIRSALPRKTSHLVADLEPVEAAVLEVAADDRTNADVLAHPGHARLEHADRARDDLDLRAVLGRGVELLDHGLVRERVHLEPDARVLAIRRRLTGRADPLDQAVRSPNGATRIFWNRDGRPKPVR